MSALKIPVSSQDQIQGSAKAALTLVEYGDYECPHCGTAYSLVKELQTYFGERLRFVYRNFPLSNIHPHAQSAAEVAEFAASKGNFWEMHDLLFENQDRLGDVLYAELAQKLALDSAELKNVLVAQSFTDRVRADFTGGVRSGVNGTPTFFLNGQRYDGPMDDASMVRAIERAAAS